MPHDLTRRRFMQATGMTLAAGAFALNARAQETAPAKKIGYALVGIGQLTKGQLLPAFAKCQHCRPTALVSGDPAKAKEFAAKYGIKESSIYNYENYDNLKDNPDVDVVYIVLPNSMHHEYTIRAAKAGKHVLCEKPMANTVQECQEMIDACKSAGKKLMIGYRLRYEPHHQKAIELCRGTLGPVKAINSDFGFNLPPGNWRLDKKLAGGGPLPDVGVYCINMTRYLTGEEPIEIAAQLHQPKDDPRFATVEESAVWWMRFPGGALAHCGTSYGMSVGNHFKAIMKDAQVEMNPAFSYNGLKMTVRNRGKMEPVALPPVDQFAAEMDHFAECILNDKPVRTPGEEGLADVKVLRAIYDAAEGRKVVKL